MSNLFKKGFASIALASAMASGVFAGNAAYIDVKVNYLSGMGKAVLGYDNSNPDTNKRLEEVELLVSILDKDGNYATKDFGGASNLEAVTISTIGSGAIASDVVASDTSIITRGLKSKNNVQRFVLDYSVANLKTLMDKITFVSGTGSGKIERTVTIDLKTRDARGLIVRATPNSDFKTEDYINEEFANIDIIGEGIKLNLQSTKAPGGLVGLSVPIQVYASTFANNASTAGRFTFAPNLEGKTIVVQALGDYDKDGTPSTVLNSVELKMINGQASGSIVITNSMPATANGVTVTSPQTAGYGDADDVGGLGIAFVAYVKEKQSINNYTSDADKKIRDNTDMASFSFDTMIGTATTGLRNGADTIQVKSGEPTALKVGTIDLTATKLSKLWENTSEIFNVSEGTDINSDDDTITAVTLINDVTKSLTVVDSYGNPAIGSPSSTATLKLDGESDATASSTIVKAGTDSTATISTNTASHGVTTVVVKLSDGDDFNNTLSIKKQTLTINAADGVLSNVKAKDLMIHTLPLIEVTKNGGPSLIDAIEDVRTIDEFSQPDHAFVVKKATDVKRANENDMTVVIKVGVDDPIPDDRNVTFRVYVKNKSGETEFLEGGDLAKYDFKIIENGKTVATAGVTVPNFTEAGLLYDDTYKTNTVDGLAGDNYQRFDFRAAGTTTAGSKDTIAADDAFTIQISTASGSETVAAVATIMIKDFNIAAIKEEEIIITIPANEDKYTAAYVDVYMENVGDSLTEIPVGSIVNFKFTGSAVSTGDVVEIDMNSTHLWGQTINGKTNEEGRIGLVGSDISDNTDGKIKTTLPENHIVSVVLYDANQTDKGAYGFQRTGAEPVKINGRTPVWLNLKDDDETADVLELAKSNGITTLRPKKDAISQIRVNLPATPIDKGDGSEEDEADKFGTDADFIYDGMIDNAVKTGLIYSLFNTELDVVLLDKYKNEIEGLKEDIGKDVTYTTTDGMEFKNNGADNSWVKFKAEAAGTEQTLTLTRTKADGEKITKTMTWTNIKLNELNTKFMVTTDSNGPTDDNTGAFDVVNSEVVVKIIGDGHTKQSSTTIKVVHSDKTATLRFVKVNGLKATNLYTNALVGATSATGDVVQGTGNYYILSSDKVGDVTITATAKGKDSKDADITVTGTHTVTFDAIDLDKPVINAEDVKVGNGEVTVIVQDANLDTAKTTVVVNDKNGKKITEGVYANGKFTAKVASAGIYQIFVTAFDMAGNVQLDDDGKPVAFKFTRVSGEGAPTLEEEAAAMLVSKKEYTVAGTFTSHKFGDDNAKNWVYTKKSDGKAYQLLGNTPSDEEVFGWKEVEVKASTSNVWYMINTGEGRFDWALANADGIAYKLKGAKADGSFDFSGRLNLNVSHKDGMLTFTAK